jgi:hypothetical protein
MAEIDIERRPKNRWSLVLAMIILLLVVGAAWYLASAPDDRTPDIDRVDEQQQVPPGTPPTATPDAPRQP